MSSISSLILESLDELVEDDFERFKQRLTKNMEQDFSSVPRSKLEKAKRHNVMELMVDQFRAMGAARITVQLLKQIGQERLTTALEKKLKGHAQAAEADGASSSSSLAAGVSLNISANETSNAEALVLSGGTYGQVNINLTTTQQ